MSSIVDIESRYLRLDTRRCWRCSTDDLTWARFELDNRRRLVCRQCRERLAQRDLFYRRAFALYRAVEPGPPGRLRGLLWPAVQAYWDIKDFKREEAPEREKLPFLAKAISTAVAELAQEAKLDPDATLLAPVPNFNAARRHVADITAAATTPFEVVEDLLTCTRDGKLRAQQLSLDDRSRARQDAYVCEADLEGRPVILVDDIFVSGTTLNAAAKACREAGASRVYGVMVARVLKPKWMTEEFPELSDGRLEMILRDWWPVPADGRVQLLPGEVPSVRLRFICRVCPRNVVTESLAAPSTGATVACHECGTSYTVDVGPARHSLVEIRVSGCRAADVQVSFDRRDA